MNNKIKQIIELKEEYLGGKREETVSGHDYYMMMAKAASLKSKDPNTQVGACIVKDDEILSIGCNNPPKNWDEKEFPFGNNVGEIGEMNTKYPYIIHAEMDAVANYKGSIKDLEGSTLYVTLFPCINCAKLITKFGIKNVVYFDIRTKQDDTVYSSILLSRCNISFINYKDLKEKELQGVDIDLNLKNNDNIKLLKYEK